MATAKHEENDGIHLERIIGAVPCGRHAADIGKACWNIGSLHGILRAICDKRARAAGANAPITQDPKHGNAPVYHKKKDYTS